MENQIDLVNKIIVLLFPTINYDLTYVDNTYIVKILNYCSLDNTTKETHLVTGESKIPIFRFYDYLDLIIPHLSDKIFFYYHNGEDLIKIHSPHHTSSFLCI